MQKYYKASLTVGFVIVWLVQVPLVGSMYFSGHPAIASGVAVAPPVTAPIPAEYESPISAKKRPMPHPLATLREVGKIRTSHCLIPRSDKNVKMNPSMKTAARARP
jgi:hypothetical protein